MRKGDHSIEALCLTHEAAPLGELAQLDGRDLDTLRVAGGDEPVLLSCQADESIHDGHAERVPNRYGNASMSQ